MSRDNRQSYYDSFEEEYDPAAQTYGRLRNLQAEMEAPLTAGYVTAVDGTMTVLLVKKTMTLILTTGRRKNAQYENFCASGL